MATLILVESDMDSRRKSKRHQNMNSKKRGGGYFTVQAQNTLSLLDQNYHPDVEYSLKKKERWNLLEECQKNPAALFDQDNCPDHLNIAVCQPRRRITRSRFPPTTHFYHQGANGIFEAKDSSKKRHKNMNLQSMMMEAKLKDAAKINANDHQTVEISRAQLLFQQNPTAAELQSEIEECHSVAHQKFRKHQSRNRRMNDYVKEMFEEASEESYEEEWLSEEEDFFDDPTQLELRKVCVETDNQEFEIIDESEVSAVKDKVNIHARLVYLPEIILSFEYLETVFDNSMIEGSNSSGAFVINISDMVQSGMARRMPSTECHYQAYVILEKAGDYLSVRMNCYVNADVISDICPPSFKDSTTVEEIVNDCFRECIYVYGPALIAEKRPQILEVSTYSVPLNEQMQMKEVSVNSVLPSRQSKSVIHNRPETEVSNCGICFDSLIPGRFSVLSGCGHAFCETCWKQHLLSQIYSRRLDIHCPSFECDYSVDIVTKLRHLSLNVIQEHDRRVIFTTLESDEDFVWCPNSSCSRPLRLLGFSQHRQRSPAVPLNVWCSCGTLFCPSCRQEAHWPVSCTVYRSFIDDLKSRGEWKPQWQLADHTPVNVPVKPCPECHHMWLKTGGCNRMQCPLCGALYCWHCCISYSFHSLSYPCTPWESYDELKTEEHIIQPEFTPLHLRMLAETASLQTLKQRYLRLLKRAMQAETSHPCKNSSNLESTVMSLLRPLSECAQVSQFAKLASLHEENQLLKQQLIDCSSTCEQVAAAGLTALSSLNAAEVANTRSEAFLRLRDCQVKGHDSVLQLKLLFSEFH